MIKPMTDDDDGGDRMVAVSGKDEGVDVKDYYTPERAKKIKASEKRIQKKKGSGFVKFLIILVILLAGCFAAWLFVPSVRTWVTNLLGKGPSEVATKEKGQEEEKKEAPKEVQIDTKTLLENAALAMEQHDYQAAVDNYQKILKAEPGNEDALAGLEKAEGKAKFYAPQGKILVGEKELGIHVPIDFQSYRFENIKKGSAKPLFEKRFVKNQEVTLFAELRDIVIQIVLVDAYGANMEEAFNYLANSEHSAHFGIGTDGKIYQLLNLVKTALHSGANEQIAIVIALQQTEIADSKTSKKPDKSAKKKAPPPKDYVVKTINGREIKGYNYTDAQYQSLIELTDGMMKYFPRIMAKIPRNTAGDVLHQNIDGFEKFSGILGEFHTTITKSTPGPGLDWQRIEKSILERYPER
jgi:N-acetyl-anhydromuramyl-L-alanine amidase AmpD